MDWTRPLCRLSNPEAVRVTPVRCAVGLGLISLVQGAGDSGIACTLTHRRDNRLLRECTVLREACHHMPRARSTALTEGIGCFFAVFAADCGL